MCLLNLASRIYKKKLLYAINYIQSAQFYRSTKYHHAFNITTYNHALETLSIHQNVIQFYVLINDHTIAQITTSICHEESESSYFSVYTLSGFPRQRQTATETDHSLFIL